VAGGVLFSAAFDDLFNVAGNNLSAYGDDLFSSTVQLAVTHTVLMAVTGACGDMYNVANSDS
jgi:hypothetical protein